MQRNRYGSIFIVYIIKDTVVYADYSVVKAVADIAQGLAIGMLLAGLIMSSRYGAKVRAFKQRLFRKNVN